MLIGSLVELHVGLHSCQYFSHLEKLLLKASLTPPRYLAVCRASSAFSYHNPDSFSTPGGSIENVSASSITSRHLVDRSRMFLPPRLLLDTWWIDQASSLVFDFLILDTCSTPYLSSFTNFRFSNLIFSPCLCIFLGFLFSQL